ncbi:MAG TPA: N-acetylmuramoyl-L-alanine amidase [Negativicutes bacterium]|nr:N-acetylmuramoyl-L-alanine amidase [Negativicutes bacterium]
MSEFSYITDIGLSWPTPRVKRKTTDHIQIHHTVGKYGTPGRWLKLHQDRIKDGQRGVPYSYLILQDGTVYLGRGHEYGHGGVRDDVTNNANQRSVAIALDDDMRGDGLPAEKQLAAALRLTRDLMALYRLPASAVLGHNEIPLYQNGNPTGKTYATLCPCIDMAAFRAALEAVAAPEPTPEPPVLTLPALYTYTGATFVNVRGGPGTAHPVLGKLSNGRKCIVLAVADGWAEAILHEQDPMLRGWCINTYLRRG